MTGEAGPGETTGLASAQAYAAQMTSACTTAAERTRLIADGLAGHGLTGRAIAAIQRAHDLTAQAGAAWAQAGTTLNRQNAVKEAYAVAPEAGSKTFLTDSTPAMTEPHPSPAAAGNASGRPPAQPDAVAVEWTDPDGDIVRGRIIKRTKSSAHVDWGNGRIEQSVKFTDPALRWLTQDDVDAEDAAAARWSSSVRGVGGMVAYQADDENVVLTAGTAAQVADINPESDGDPLTKDRYALFGIDGELPKLLRTLNAASRAAAAGKPYRGKIRGDDIGDVELAVNPQPQAEPTVTMTVVPYTDEGDIEDRAELLKELDELREADLAAIPHEIEDDDRDGHMRRLTDEERAHWAALIHADYETDRDRCLRENPEPQPLVVNLTVAMVGRLRDQLAG